MGNLNLCFQQFCHSDHFNDKLPQQENITPSLFFKEKEFSKWSALKFFSHLTLKREALKREALKCV